MNKTILKWAGSKVRIMEQLRPHLPKTKRLVEPFAGSCAVMMNTDYEQYLTADVNRDLINLYKIIKYGDCNSFIEAVAVVFGGANEDGEYYRIRDCFNEERNFRFSNPFEMAVWFLYLNRHCYNGLCRYSQKSGFNVPFGGYKKPYLPRKEIHEFSAKSAGAAIICQSWEETLLQIRDGDGVYCDPPYMGKDFTQYQAAGFSDGDQVALAETLAVLYDHYSIPVTASNSLAAKELYADLGFTIHEIEAPRSISANGNRKPVTEIIATLGA